MEQGEGGLDRVELVSTYCSFKEALNLKPTFVPVSVQIITQSFVGILYIMFQNLIR